MGILALAAILIIGLAESVEYAAYETLLQQSVPENMIGRAVGTMDSAFLMMMLVGTAISGVRRHGRFPGGARARLRVKR
jgi:hypothetical protein